jgi:hypothetical protein
VIPVPIKKTIMYKIFAISKYGTEEIDQAETISEANYLAGEYRMAYGPEFTITIKRNGRSLISKF